MAQPQRLACMTSACGYFRPGQEPHRGSRGETRVQLWFAWGQNTETAGAGGPSGQSWSLGVGSEVGPSHLLLQRCVGLDGTWLWLCRSCPPTRRIESPEDREPS